MARAIVGPGSAEHALKGVSAERIADSGREMVVFVDQLIPAKKRKIQEDPGFAVEALVLLEHV